MGMCTIPPALRATSLFTREAHKDTAPIFIGAEIILHVVGCRNAEAGQGVFDDGGGAAAQQDAGLTQGGGGILDAAVGIELVEGGGHLAGIAIQAAGVTLNGGQTDLFGQTAQIADQIQLGGLHQQGQIGRLDLGGDVVLGQSLQDGLDAGVGVLDVIDRVFAVVADGQTQVELDGRGRVAGERRSGRRLR